MKKLVSFLMLFVAFFQLNGQCPMSTLVLNSQSEVDAFPANYPGCTMVLFGLGIQQNVTNVDSLVNIISVAGDLFFGASSNLANINGLANLTSVGGDLAFFNSDALADIDGLTNLTSVGGDLAFQFTNSLTNVDGLINLTSVGGTLSVGVNTSLANVDGLTNIVSVGGNLSVNNNLALSDCCGLFHLIDGGGVAGTITIEDNNLEGCNSENEIILGGPCTTNVGQNNLIKKQISIFPNPATDFIHVVLTGIIGEYNAKILDIKGAFIREVVINNDTAILDVRELPIGVFILEVSQGGFNDKQMFVKM